SRSELWELDLATHKSLKLGDFSWLNSASYSPDGSRLLLIGGPSLFGDVGKNVPEGVIPNDYDGQIYIWDPKGEQPDSVQAVAREFDPAIKSAVWHRGDGKIYLDAEDGEFGRLVRYDPEADTFTMIELPFEVTSAVAFARKAPVAVAIGSSMWSPPQVAAVDLTGDAARVIHNPGADWFQTVRTGGSEDFAFTAANGKTIAGRVYFPPGLDRTKKYPALVYYYGGTSPVGRGFGGRYPKEWWASRGYVVYVLQPSGATGFGQEFSAAHVNDWGSTTIDEVIEGTGKMLEALPFVDGKRVGCLGASYGGFMTMGLVTKTDMFAAAVSHAGISGLASYWGEGYWGAGYSAVATSGSYPWNRRDIYVDNSPIFHADKVNTPILLTHGTSDPNVPPGESDQFFTALRILGKEVEYIRVDGQEHWILDHAKRLQWSASIVAWFDRWLQDSPEWWDALYPALGSDGNGNGNENGNGNGN
ncbi:MAG: S9 family peptidase, partial [Acidobacteria bacterium]|nr:S9 family peptidase [Candidatus Polarisedimenticola svalbardensis]